MLLSSILTIVIIFLILCIGKAFKEPKEEEYVKANEQLTKIIKDNEQLFESVDENKTISIILWIAVILTTLKYMIYTLLLTLLVNMIFFHAYNYINLVIWWQTTFIAGIWIFIDSIPGIKKMIAYHEGTNE